MPTYNRLQGLPINLRSVRKEALSPLPDDLVALVHETIASKGRSKDVDEWLRSLEICDPRLPALKARRTSYDPGDFSKYGGRVRTLVVDGHTLVLKRTHDGNARETIRKVKARSARASRDSTYSFVDIPAYEVGKNVILMPRVRAPCVADIVGLSSNAPEENAIVAQSMRDLMISQEVYDQLLASNLRLSNRGIGVGNVWLMDVAKSQRGDARFLFALHLDIY